MRMTTLMMFAAFCLVASPVVPVQAAELKTFTVTSGPMGGDFYSVGGVVGELAKSVLPGVTVTVTTGGAVENLPKINAAKAEIGTSMTKLLDEAYKGKGFFEGKKPMPNLSSLMYLADIPQSFFLVREDFPANSLAEIRDKKLKLRLLSSKKGSSPATAAEAMLGHHGITYDNLRQWGGTVSFVSYAEASSLIQDGHADAFVGPMVSAISELTTTVKMKMLTIEPGALEKLKADGYVTLTLPKDKYYFVKQYTPHMAEAIVLAVRADLPEDVGYKMAKAICENADRIRQIHQTYSTFDPANAHKNSAGLLHPGAAKYYREKGYME